MNGPRRFVSLDRHRLERWTPVIPCHLTRGGAAAHRATHDSSPYGSEPYFRGPQSGFFCSKHKERSHRAVNAFSVEALAHWVVGVLVDDTLFLCTDIKSPMDLSGTVKYR